MCPVDWVKVSEMVFGGLITLSITALGIALHYRLSKWGNRVRDEKLFDLAALRGEAVEIRNEGEGKVLFHEDLEDWLRRATEIEDTILVKAGEISKVLRKRLQYHDRIDIIRYRGLLDVKQKNWLWNLSTLLKRVDVLLSKYEF